MKIKQGRHFKINDMQFRASIVIGDKVIIDKLDGRFWQGSKVVHKDWFKKYESIIEWSDGE